LIAFVRLKSNPRVFSRPDSAARCWEVAESWLAEANVFVPEPGPEHRRIFGRLLASAHGNTVNDAYLAALAIENGCIVCSTDSDFALFAPELRWENPLRHQTP
jgi:predicted nucleic acid-binding protein